MSSIKEIFLEEARRVSLPLKDPANFINSVIKEYLESNLKFYDRKTALCKQFLADKQPDGSYNINQVKYKMTNKSSHYFIYPYGNLYVYHYGGLSLESYIWLTSLDFNLVEKEIISLLDPINKLYQERTKEILEYNCFKPYSLKLQEYGTKAAVVVTLPTKRELYFGFYKADIENITEEKFMSVLQDLDILIKYTKAPDTDIDFEFIDPLFKLKYL